MTRLRHLLLAALLAGVAAGLVASAVQSIKIAPLIAAAEGLGSAAAPADHTHAASGPVRAGYTVLFNSLAGIGFGLLLCAAYNMAGPVSLRAGVLWGGGGFLAFFVAPALGLPPSLPGSELAALGARQAWWLGTVVATAAGLLAVALSRVPWRKALGVALLVAPHVIGAPHAALDAAVLPLELSRRFLLWSTVAAAAFWLVLGGVSGWLVGRWERQAHP